MRRQSRIGRSLLSALVVGAAAHGPQVRRARPEVAREHLGAAFEAAGCQHDTALREQAERTIAARDRAHAGHGAVIVLQILFTYAPFMQAIFGTEAMPLYIWKWLLLGGVVFFTLVELEKILIRWAYPKVEEIKPA